MNRSGRIKIERHACLLAGLNPLQIGFLEVGVDPPVAAIDEGEERRADCDHCAGADIDFTDDAIAEIAAIAVAVNSSVENIGARRLQTVMERVLDDISFEGPDKAGETLTIDAAYVRKHVGDLAENADLSRYIL